MKEIILSQNMVSTVDDEDFELLNKYKWFAQKSDIRFYAIRNVWANGKHTTETMHHLLKGKTGLFVDHIDGNGLNNQKTNLRVCSPQQNNFNRTGNRRNASGLKGVRKTDSGKYYAQIRRAGQYYYLGIHKSATEAATIYNAKAKELFGEFARLNRV